MDKLKEYWTDLLVEGHSKEVWWKNKIESLKQRDASIVKVSGNGTMTRKLHYDNQTHYEYVMHLQFLIKQQHQFILEEQVIPYRYEVEANEIKNHEKVEYDPEQGTDDYLRWKSNNYIQIDNLDRFNYNRLEAVKYAERWWNSYNPAYQTFDVDCTNYISQCLQAGGAPTWGEPVRERGWWYSGNSWSFSWAVAHSMRWYLSGSDKGLKGQEVESPEELEPGDVICYDFEGDGRWDHNTIVVTKDANGMPLVNAHTDNSRHRYWAYEDSTAWTPEIQYKFFRIGEN